MTTCDQCGTRTHQLAPSVHGPLCQQCAFRQDEHDQPGYGLSATTFGFLSEEE